MFGKLCKTLLISAVVCLCLQPQYLMASSELDNLGAEVDLGLGYCILNGEGIKDIYSGVPQAGIGFSFLVTPEVRTYFRVDYAIASGNPYENIIGFEAPRETTIKSVPLTFGLKYNLSQNQKLRLQLGLGMQAAWQQEEIMDTLADDNTDLRKVSDYNFGFTATFAPELVLGNNILGFEFGYGGAKGDIKDKEHSHNIDLTGFTTKLYFALGL